MMAAEMNRIRYNESLAAYTTWRVGGEAEQFVEPGSRAELLTFLSQLPEDVPVTWLGLGSNVLVRDGGVRGVVIATHRALREIQRGDGDRVLAEAGVTMAKLARFASRHQLTGVEFAGGVPGTVGGALAMNAGAFGQETWDVVEWVETVDRRGRVRRGTVSEFEPGYRQVKLPADQWFLGACFLLEVDSGERVGEKVRHLIVERNRKQPIGTANAGSVFRNPPGDYAARLLEASGIKGKGIGGARFSEKHANFIVNDGSATAADIEDLIHLGRDTVQRKFGIRLQPEVRIIGEGKSEC